MHLEVGKCYKHRRMIDVAFYVLEIQGQGDEGMTIIALWLNYRGKYPIGQSDTLCITREQMPYYDEVEWKGVVW